MQFLVKAMDYTDEDAINRRMEHRPAHIAGIKEMMSVGSFLSGGAILNEAGKMVGSTLHLEFPDWVSLQAHLESDPYSAGNVWETIEIDEVKLVAF